jgi:CDP-diacylglycerol--serine O-phosphatidyltransferase
MRRKLKNVREGIKIRRAVMKENMKKRRQKARENFNRRKEKVKSGIVKVRKTVQLIKPILLVDGVTLSNAMFGLLSIFASITGFLKVACYFLLAAGVLDYLDGKIARKLGRTTAFGKELDSLADIVSFGVGPAVLGFVYSGNPFIILPILVFLACGIIRLAKFNTQLVPGIYFGMPITLNAAIFSILYFTGVQPSYWIYAYLASAMLMVSPFKIKKFL